MTGSPIATLRLSKPLQQWFDAYIEQVGLSRTELLRDLLEAVRDHRLIILDKPLPLLINDGSVPECPVSICPDPR